MTLSAATSTVQTLLAFDFGQKRIGVAVGNSLTGAARPLATQTEQTTDGRFARIQALLKEWQPTGLVVGRPLHPDGPRMKSRRWPSVLRAGWKAASGCPSFWWMNATARWRRRSGCATRTTSTSRAVAGVARAGRRRATMPRLRPSSLNST